MNTQLSNMDQELEMEKDSLRAVMKAELCEFKKGLENTTLIDLRKELQDELADIEGGTESESSEDIPRKKSYR